MGLRYNPFTGNFDLTRSPGSYLDGEVATYGDLPLDTAAAPLNSAWLVRGASGLWLLSRKPAGIYIRTATGGTDRDADYTYAGTFPDVFSDANFVVYNDADSTKNLKLDTSAITTGTTRTLTVPDASGTLPLLETANTFTQNQTFSGTNSVAPNQTAASGSSVMTRDLADARFGTVYVLTLSNQLSAASTTNEISAENVTLPAGTYRADFIFNCGTASSTAGLNAGFNLTNANAVYYSGFYTRGLSQTENAAANITCDLRVISAPADDVPFADSPNRTVRAMGVVFFNISQSRTIGLRIRQRQTTDASNPAYMKTDSRVVFTRLP